MSIKLLATDLDGTLVADLHTIAPRTQAAIKAAVEQGVMVTIATGREYEITRKFVETLGLTGPIICHQGAVIQDAQTGQLIAAQTLSLTKTHQLVDLARSMNLALSLHYNGHAHTEQPTTQSLEFFSNIGTAMTKVDDLKQTDSREPVKAIIVHPAAEGETILSELQTSLNGSMKVFRSLDVLIEVTPHGVSKGHALATLAAQYGLAKNEVMAMGDQDNDVDMIAWAGIGVAMGDASPKAKAAADHIAPPLADEGAAWAIEHFILGES
jgi:Cof subfamily protein (haloacid dehalogenase superfamily)